MTLFDVKNVPRLFGTKPAVDNISFSINSPACVGIIGRSGAGKPTFLRMMNRLAYATKGQIFVDGQDILVLKGAQTRNWQSQCAMIFRADCVQSESDGTQPKTGKPLGMLRIAFDLVHPIKCNML